MYLRSVKADAAIEQKHLKEVEVKLSKLYRHKPWALAHTHCHTVLVTPRCVAMLELTLQLPRSVADHTLLLITCAYLTSQASEHPMTEAELQMYRCTDEG